MKKAKELREIEIKVRVTESEDEIIKEKAKKLGKNKARYIREAAQNAFVLNLDTKGLDSLAYEINKIGININQIAHQANIFGEPYKSDIKYLKEKQEHIEEILIKYYETYLKLTQLEMGEK